MDIEEALLPCNLFRNHVENASVHALDPIPKRPRDPWEPWRPAPRRPDGRNKVIVERPVSCHLDLGRHVLPQGGQALPIPLNGPVQADGGGQLPEGYAKVASNRLSRCDILGRGVALNSGRGKVDDDVAGDVLEEVDHGVPVPL